jgi:hypothetical protein
MRQAFGVRHWASVGLCGLGAAIALPRPAVANDLSILVYPVVIWPIGALLVLVLLTLIVFCLRAKRPAKRLGLWTSIIAGLAGLVFPPYVFIMGISRAIDLNLMTVLPVALLALAGVMVGMKVRR